MNLLFINNSNVNPLNSGIQRITSVLALGFSAQKINCYGAYFDHSQESKERLFIDKIKLDFSHKSSCQLQDFIKKYNISQIIVQECYPLKRLTFIWNAIQSIPSCQLLYCFHSMPGKEFIRPSFHAELFRYFHAPQKIQTLKKILVASLPIFLYNQFVRKKVQKEYSLIYQSSHKIVLLSEYFIPQFIKLSQISHINHSKFIAIGNALPFKHEISTDILLGKQKEVLIVSRLSERQKRISIALKIWQRIEQSENYKDWRLKILGSGPDEKYYHHLAQKLQLKQVDFEGKQAPKSYYQQASICMQTSSHEGLSMVLLEAQQMGSVPIAFSSFDSIYDIIEHEYNGILVPYGNIEEYAKQLMQLMDTKTKRNKMAIYGMNSCQKFAEEQIINMWQQHLKTMTISHTIL